MRVIMFDRQSLFIHGAIHSLQKLIPEINITGSCQAEDLWAQISASPSAIVMIDGNLIEDEGIAAGSDHAAFSVDTRGNGSG